jgi:hypothetical protein
MTRPSRARRARVSPVLSPADESRVEALTVAMALAPGVYARNRMFALFANPAVQRAKTRAALLRGIVKHLGRACAVTLEREEVDYVLRYQIPALRLTRVAELTRVELATLRLLAVRAGASCLLPEDEDRSLVETALARLLLAGGDSGTLARAAQGGVSAPTPPAE